MGGTPPCTPLRALLAATVCRSPGLTARAPALLPAPCHSELSKYEGALAADSKLEGGVELGSERGEINERVRCTGSRRSP